MAGCRAAPSRWRPPGPVPLEGKVVQRGRAAKRKAAAQPAAGKRADGRKDAAAADGDAPPASA